MARAELNRLMNEFLPMAEQLLKKNGEFFPFGGYVDAQGEIAHLAGWTGDERPPAQDVIEALVAGLRDLVERRDIRATAVCLDVRVVPAGRSDKSDAICVRLEHADGEAVDVYLPYIRSESGEFVYGELFAGQGTQAIFAGGSAAP